MIRLKDRSIAFGKKDSVGIIQECLLKIDNPQKVAIAKDYRDKDSNQVRIFRTDADGLIAIPCYERDDGKVEIITIKNVYHPDNEGGQFWFVNRYNEFAREKGLSLAPLRFGS